MEFATYRWCFSWQSSFSMRIFFKGQYIWNTYICMFLYYAVKTQCSPCSDTSLCSCDVVTYDNASLEVLTAMMLTVQVFWNVTFCHWVFCNVWKECSAFVFRVKLSKALQSFRLLGTAQCHSTISQKTWIWIFIYVEKDWKAGKPWGPKFIRCGVWYYMM